MGMQNKAFGDLVTFTRASGGTSFRPVGYGPELVANGDFSGGSTGWTLANGATVSGGALQLPTANATAISTSPNCVAGRIYRFEFDYVSGSGSAYINVQMGSAVFGAVTTTTARRYSIVHRATATDSIKIWQDGGAAGSAVIDNISVQEVILDRAGDPIQLFTAPTNVPRIDYDPATGACKGLLIEEQRTNLMTYSNHSEVGAWTFVNTTNAVGSDYFVKSSSAPAYITRTITRQATGVATSAQIKAKAGTLSSFVGLRIQGDYPHRCDAVFNLSTGQLVATASGTNFTGISAAISPAPDGYWLCTLTGTATGTGVVQLVFGPTDGSSVSGWEGSVGIFDAYIKDAQLELGSFPTSYIPTTGASATRAADVASINTLSPWFNRQEGTLFAEFKAGDFSGLPPPFVAITDNGQELATVRSPTQVGTWNGSAEANAANASVNTLVGAKFAVGYSAAGVSVVLGGGTPGTSASPFSLTTTALIQLGQAFPGQRSINGHIRAIRYTPKRLSDAQLQAMTA